MVDLDGIAAASQGVRFDQLQATNISRFEFEYQFVLAFFQRTFPGEFHGGFVRSKCTTDQAGLSDINARFAFIQQYKGFFAVDQVAKFQELSK